MDGRLRWQARSHRGFVVERGFVNTRETCGSEPARESGGSGNDDVEWMDAFASKPAPTGDLW